MFAPEFVLDVQYIYLKVIKSLFRQGVSTIQFSVSITHNSKMVGLIAKRLFGQTITLFP